MTKPRFQIKKFGGKTLDMETFAMTGGEVKRYTYTDEYWIVRAEFTTFEGAKVYDKFRSMYLCKALFKADEWLKEKRKRDNLMQLELRNLNSKRHLSESYSTKRRLRLYVNERGEHVAKYDTKGNGVFIGYGSTPESACTSLSESLLQVLKLADGNRIGKSTKSDEYYGPTKHKRWWRFWRS